MDSSNAISSRAVETLIATLVPGSAVQAIEPLSPDAAVDSALGPDQTEKSIGYGEPVCITVSQERGKPRRFVLHTATANDFGHDRCSDRAQAMLLAFDTFGAIPHHVKPLDVGAIARDGSLQSVRDCGEFYLLTEFAEGSPYAGDLRRVVRDQRASSVDLKRCERLAHYLEYLHRDRGGRPAVYTRSIRDLVGHGEGIFGIIDGYPAEVPGASAARLQAIETRCARWRWRLRSRQHRLRTIHGDFHPFNILFDDRDDLALLDAARGCKGDPADDVTCLAINYVFFALDHPSAWAQGLGVLWRRFWHCYMERSRDRELLEVAPLFFAWRALVLANPAWYPAMSLQARNSLLGWIEAALDVGTFNPESAEKLFS